ncbi:hypothetical protein ACJJTC_015878 [Scirpophaga incertulas]
MAQRRTRTEGDISKQPYHPLNGLIRARAPAGHWSARAAAIGRGRGRRSQSNREADRCGLRTLSTMNMDVRQSPRLNGNQRPSKNIGGNDSAKGNFDIAPADTDKRGTEIC